MAILQAAYLHVKLLQHMIVEVQCKNHYEREDICMRLNFIKLYATYCIAQTSFREVCFENKILQNNFFSQSS